MSGGSDGEDAHAAGLSSSTHRADRWRHISSALRLSVDVPERDWAISFVVDMSFVAKSIKVIMLLTAPKADNGSMCNQGKVGVVCFN